MELKVGDLLVRNGSKSGIEELDEIIGYEFYVQRIVDGVAHIITCHTPIGITPETPSSGFEIKIGLVGEEYFETRKTYLVPKPDGLEMEDNDWFVLCSLFSRYSPKTIKDVTDLIYDRIRETRIGTLIGILSLGPE